MIAHIIPKIYLKSWKIEDSKLGVYIIDKDSGNCNRSNLKKLTNTGMTKLDEYILKIDEVIDSALFDELFQLLLNFSKENYLILYENKDCLDLGIFKKILTRNIDIQKLVIYDKRKGLNQALRINNYINSIEDEWKHRFSGVIEDFFSINFESNFEKFSEYISSLSVRDSVLISDSNMEFMLEFLAIQFSRDYKKSAPIIEAITKKVIKKTGRQMKYNVSKVYWLSLIYKYILYKDTKIEDYSDNVISNFSKNNKGKIFVLFKGDSFITSDNPIFMIKSDEIFFGMTGTFFPINSNNCLFIYECDSDEECNKLLISDCPNSVIKYINFLIRKNSIKYFISQSLMYSDKISCNLIEDELMDCLGKIGFVKCS